MKDIKALVNEYLTIGTSLTKMAAREGCSRWFLTNEFKKLNITIINRLNRCKFNELVFDSIDTEEKAYWLGFIFADGWISSTPLILNRKSLYAFELSLLASDKEHLNKFNTFMEYSGNNVVIGETLCNHKKFLRCRWSVSNKHFWHTLNNIGCTPNKSLTLKFPEQSIFSNNTLIRHFIRGYFDGDGCFSRSVYIHTVSPTISLLGTPQFLKSLLEHIPVIGKMLLDKRRSELTKILYFSKTNGIKFINYIYEDSSIYLDRKFRLYQFFKNGSRSVKEFMELLSGNIGESPDKDNTEINTDIKEPVSSYSIDSEPHNETIICPRVSDNPNG